MIINDPNGQAASVNSDGRLVTSAITYPSAHHVNHIDGKAYSFRVTATPTAAGDCFAYVTNLDDEDMVIDLIIANVETTETLLVKLGDSGTAAGGTDVTLTNLNAGSGNLAEVTAQSGNDITGLSGGQIAVGFCFNGGDCSKQVPVPPSFIVPKNKTISLYAVTGGIEINAGMLITFHAPKE